MTTYKESGLAKNEGTAGTLPDSPGLDLFPAILIILVIMFQGAGWAGWLESTLGGAGKLPYAVIEMCFIFLLVWNGWRIRRHVYSLSREPDSQLPMPGTIATLTFASLAVCSLGDVVNRNFGVIYYAYDSVIEHSYLADSVWFFLPGYSLFMIAAWYAVRDRVPVWLRVSSLILAALAGTASFFNMVLPGISMYVLVMTGCYTVIISLLVPAGFWIAIAYGRSAWHVALGAVLAAAADALIGKFWLFGEGWYPGIAHLNFIVYFISQALLQRFPLAVAMDFRKQR